MTENGIYRVQTSVGAVSVLSELSGSIRGDKIIKAFGHAVKAGDSLLFSGTLSLKDDPDV